MNRERLMVLILAALLIIIATVLFINQLSNRRAAHQQIVLQEEMPTANLENINDFIHNGLSILGSDNALADTEKKFGKPLSDKTTMIDYAYRVPQHVLTYNGLKVTIVQNSDLSKAFVTNAELTSGGIPVLFDLRVGADRKKVEQVLGLPMGAPLNAEKYEYSSALDMAGSLAEIYFNKNKISKIAWTLYID